MPSHTILLELTRRYCEPHRHYHGIEHIAWMLAMGRDLALDRDQLLAIWFHDAIYDARSSTNEADSAALAVELLAREAYPEAGIRVVERIVLDTAQHVPTIPAARLVIDLDLASLGAPREVYAANTRKIRREFSHLTDEQFDAGRAGFLEDMLARERIYSTDWGAKRETDARDNLRRDLESIRNRLTT